MGCLITAPTILFHLDQDLGKGKGGSILQEQPQGSRRVFEGLPVSHH